MVVMAVVGGVVLDSTIVVGIGTDDTGSGGHGGNNPNKYTMIGLFVFVSSVTTNNITLCRSVYVNFTVVLKFSSAGMRNPCLTANANDTDIKLSTVPDTEEKL